MLLDIENLRNAVSSIPHVGQILAVTITIGVAIYKEAEKLEPTLRAEKKLAEEAEYILQTIGSYGQKLIACDPIHVRKLERTVQELNTIAEQARLHMLETACARDRHRRKYGKAAADVYECLLKPSDVWKLEGKLEAAKEKFMKELQYIGVVGGHRINIDTCPPPYVSDAKDEDTGSCSQRVRWVNVREIENDSPTFANLVPVSRLQDSEDHESWYVARVSYYGSYQPGKYKPGHGAYFGHRREALRADDFEVDVLVAEPGSVRWKRASGEFTDEHFKQYNPVEGCRENTGKKLAIARAWAREHMKIGIFTDKAIQPGKVGPGLECAYVVAGKEEKKIKEYEVLVYV